MLFSIKTLVASLAISLIMAAGSAGADTPVKDSLASVTAVSDSTLARAVRAVTTLDTALIGSLLAEDIDLIMPGEVKLEGRAKAMKYATLLMETVGGSEISVERLMIDYLPKYSNFVREAGTFILKATSGEAGQKRGIDFVGTYTFYFELQGESWILKRAFIDRKRGF